MQTILGIILIENYTNVHAILMGCLQLSLIIESMSQLRITISVGVSSFPESAPADMLEKADEALYEAKGKGRNQVCYAEPQLT